MNNCEIVDNVACGQTFQYCRTHKVEPKDCPGNAKPKGPESQAAALYQYQVAINSVAAAAAKREFKVGDKARLKRDVFFGGEDSHKAGALVTISDVYGGFIYVDGYTRQHGNGESPRSFELVSE